MALAAVRHKLDSLTDRDFAVGLGIITGQGASQRRSGGADGCAGPAQERCICRARGRHGPHEPLLHRHRRGAAGHMARCAAVGEMKVLKRYCGTVGVPADSTLGRFGRSAMLRRPHRPGACTIPLSTSEPFVTTGCYSVCSRGRGLLRSVYGAPWVQTNRPCGLISRHAPMYPLAAPHSGAEAIK